MTLASFIWDEQKGELVEDKPLVVAVSMDTSRRIWTRLTNEEVVPVTFDFSDGTREVEWMDTTAACVAVMSYGFLKEASRA